MEDIYKEFNTYLSNPLTSHPLDIKRLDEAIEKVYENESFSLDGLKKYINKSNLKISKGNLDAILEIAKIIYEYKKLNIIK